MMRIRYATFLVLVLLGGSVSSWGLLADLSITKTDSPDPVSAGGNLTYTLTVANAGPSLAPSTSISDTLPAGTSFVSVTQDSGPVFSVSTPPSGGTGTVTATLASFATGATASFTIVVNVSPATPNGTVITNTATITSGAADPNPGNNTATATTTVGASADLSVVKTDSPDPVVAGTNLIYAIAVANAGPSDAQTVTLSDPLPAGTTFVSFSQNTGPAFSATAPAVGGTGTVNATIATLATGASASFTMVLNVNGATAGGTVLSNTATIGSSTSDPTPANNTSTATTTVSAAVPALGPWHVLLLTVAILGAAIALIRRRQLA